MEGSLRVLVVDDQASMRSMLKKMLHQMGYFQYMDDASDGLEAWEKIQGMMYDLVISDVSMPRLDGIGLLRRCRAVNELRELPFLMISGQALPEFVAGAGEWGAYDYIVKPFSYSFLKERIEQIFERFRSPLETLYRELERIKDSGFCQDALERIEEVETTTPNLKLKWLNLKGECLVGLGEMEQASACFEEAMQASEVFLAAYKNYAALHQKLGNAEKAIMALEKADALSPLDLERKLTIGKMLMEEERGEEAGKFLNKVLRQAAPEEREAFRLKVAEVYLEHGHFAEAEDLFIKALKDNPDQIEAYNRLGIALRRQGKFKDAERFYQLALKNRPDNPAIHYNLGVLCLNLDDKKKAAGHFLRVLKLDPQFTKAREMLDRLEQMAAQKPSQQKKR